MLDAVLELLPEPEDTPPEEGVIRVAVIGKPNAGKSSLINRITGQERVIVSDMPGTTRDAVDTPVENAHGKYIFVDTAGIRRGAKIEDSIEKYSVLRAKAAIERADVCLIMVDANEGVTAQDERIAGWRTTRARLRSSSSTNGTRSKRTPTRSRNLKRTSARRSPI